MWNAFLAQLRSRKFVVALIAAAVAAASLFGLEVDPDKALLIMTPFLLVIGGIAYEDGQAKSAGSAPVKPGTVGDPAISPPAKVEASHMKAGGGS